MPAIAMQSHNRTESPPLEPSDKQFTEFGIVWVAYCEASDIRRPQGIPAIPI